MPTYEYRCTACGHEFEELQSMTADPLTICPKCAEPMLRRKMGSGSGMIFKGSGFYLTDYRKSGSSPATKDSKESKPSSSPSSPTPPSESKPSSESKPDKPK
jgi:putative FmdB family regulatory protein